MIRKYILFILPLVLIPCFSTCIGQNGGNTVPASLYKDLEFKMPVVPEPVFPAFSVLITDF